MAGKESEAPKQVGLVEGYKKFNIYSRNIALGVAVGAAYVGVGALVFPALLLAGGDQLQISAIDKYRNWKEKRKLAKSGLIYRKAT